MRAEIIAIGDELTTGQRLDTNSQWLSQQLTEMGFHVAFHTTVADELADNVTAFRAAFERADVVIATGGLGPTADDLTREAIAAATETKLVRDAASLAYIENLFASRGREMPERNQVQADFPEGAQPVPNPHGTAPGIEMSVPRVQREPCNVFALPGVPAEMHEMWEVTVAPKLLDLRPEPRVIRHRRIKCFGIGESALEAMLPDLIRRDREPRVGITVSDATITLRITAAAVDETTCFASMDPTIATIRESLGDLVFGEEDDELEHTVLQLLGQQDLNLSVAEWATEGLVAEWLGELQPKGTSWIAGLVVGPDQAVGKEVPHSSEFAVKIAESVRRESGSNIGLGIAAYPPNLQGADAHVCAAIATPERTRKLRLPCAAHPAIVRSRTAKQALNALRLMLTRPSQ